MGKARLDYIKLRTKYENGQWFYTEDQKDLIINTFVLNGRTFEDCQALYCCEPSAVFSKEQREVYRNQGEELDFSDFVFDEQNVVFEASYRTGLRSLLSKMCSKAKNDLDYVKRKHHRENPSEHFIVLQRTYRGKTIIRGIAKFDNDGLSFAFNPTYLNFVARQNNKSIWELGLEIGRDDATF